MNIVVLGWGSLIWCPKNLLVSSKWKTNGPELPVEFARISQDGRLTLVLLPNANPIPVLWAQMDTDNLDEARENLKKREGTIRDRIGFIDLTYNKTQSGIVNTKGIRTWAQERAIDAAVWTDLRSNFESKYRALNNINVISYLNKLKMADRKLAEEYIRKAPHQIITPFRSVIERELGWVAES